MIDLAMQAMIIPVLILPLLLFAAIAFGVLRTTALRLVPWAALPALLTAILVPDGELRMPFVLLGSTLTLDMTGRTFLLLNAILWLASGWLDGFRRQSAATVERALLCLLAMSGAFGTAVAGDVLVFFTFSTLAGYALYGLLVSGGHTAAHRAGRLLVVLMVVSDLLVFEALLILGHAAGETGFPAIRTAFLGTDSQGLLLGLLIAGYGIKGGVIGLHIWMQPVFGTSRISLLPVLTGFALSGLLAWLRLLPVGEIAWLVAGDALRWLAWISLGYVVVASVVQSNIRAIPVYAVLVLSSLWLSALGTALRYQQAWSTLFEVVLATAPQAGFVLSALLLLESNKKTGKPAWYARFTVGLSLLAAVMLVFAPLHIAGLIAAIDAKGMMQMYGVAAVFAFLLTRSLLLCISGNNTPAVTRSSDNSAAPVYLFASVLAISSLLTGFDAVAGMPLTDLQMPGLVLLVAVMLGWLSIAVTVRITPVTGFSGLVTARQRLKSVAETSGAFLNTHCLRTPMARIRLVRRGLFAPGRWLFADRIELGFRRWYIALIMLVLLGGLLAWLGEI